MYITPDRRIKPRIVCEYPAIVEGYSDEGTKYNDRVKLANLSASGLYMLANRNIEFGTKLAVTVLLTGSFDDADAPKLATNGVVVRSDPKGDGICGVAIKFNNYRFL